MKAGFVVSTALATLAVLAPVAARAETAQSGLEDIIVTAERRADTSQDVAIALSVLSGDELARRGVSNVNDLQFNVPSLEVVPAFGGGQPQFRLRGVGFEDYATNNTPTVGIYVNEVAFPIPATTQGALFDIERVEVLRGPQGTLYGRNTTGGAINFITRRPTKTLSAGFNAGYGRFDALKVEGFVSGPVSETVRVRLSGITEQGGGFQRNRATGEGLGDADRLYGRALVEWEPAENSIVTLNVHGGRDKSDQTGLYLFSNFQTGGYVGPLGPVIPADASRRNTGWGFSPLFAGLAGVDAASKPGRDNDSWGGSLTASLGLSDAVRLTSITAYENFNRKELADWDASEANESGVYWGSDVEVFSQEVRLSSEGAGPLQWVVGGYYSRETLDEVFLSDFSESLGFITHTSYRQKAESISAFGQLDYALNDKLTLTGGLRFEHEDRKLRDFSTQVVEGSSRNPTFLDGNRDTGFDKVTGKVGVEYKPAQNVLLYANASRGVKSGGFTVYNSTYSDQIDAFKPETLYAYEVGFKSEYNRIVRINGSLFYYDYRNQQVLGTVLNPETGLIGRIVNAPKSRIVGGELELQVAPSSRLLLTQSVSYKHGKYREFTDIDPTSLTFEDGEFSVGTIDRAGQSIPIARLSLQGSIAYTVPLDGYALEAAADYSFRDKLPSFLGRTFDLPDRFIVNASLTVRPESGRWSAGIFGRNIFGEKYDLTRNYFLPNALIASPGRPATYGVRFGYSL